MHGARVRIERISIDNLKNVRHGELVLSNPRRPNGPSILGLYGQNGSGKTVLIDAIGILEQCLTGGSVDSSEALEVSVGAESATLEFEFSVKRNDPSIAYRAVYRLSIKGEKGIDAAVQGASGTTRIFDERISLAWNGPNGKMRLSTMMDTARGGVFGPVAKLQALTGAMEDDLDLAVEKRLAYRESRSFLFSSALRNAIASNVPNEIARSAGVEKSLAETVLWIVDALHNYGVFELFVAKSHDVGMVALNALPFPFRVTTQQARVTGKATIPMNGTMALSDEVFEVVMSAIENMDTVLRQIIPGLAVKVVDLGPEITADGRRGRRMQLVSEREGRTIPFELESDGIKRMVSLLHLLILMYNDPSVTVAIDELDSGVFEYLLGELVGIVAERGKGQLVFTSHNLRPLETIDRGYIAFTTTNPSNRYVRMAHVKATNNLRDFYYRDIVLGGQQEMLYEPTNNSEIALAFLEAGTNDVA